MADYKTDGEMRPVPRNQVLGWVADALAAANRFAQRPDPNGWFGKADFGAAAIANALAVPALAETADNLSYGRPLTQGQGMARQMLPATAEAALAVAPVVAKWPKQAAMTAMGLMGQGDNALMRAATVYHGSPHKFDAFDAGKIGTGEGAQAYGHGLYLAESPDVAQSYIAPNIYRAFDVGPEAEKRGLKLSAGARGELLRQATANADPAIAARRLQYANAGTRELPQEKLAELIGAYQEAQKGAMYKVDLPDPMIARMLDWDKPLSQQAPGVQAAVQATDFYKRTAKLADGAGGRIFVHPDNRTGAELYKMMNDADSQSAAMLRAQGIPGIRYLDGSSRTGGAGTSNFVVFPGEENALTILERNGRPINALQR